MITTRFVDAPPARIAFSQPKAVGVVRYDVSGPNADRHAVAVRRHAAALGYSYVYTVHPPIDSVDPVGYVLGMAARLDAAVIVAYDLGHVDNQPSLVCDAGFDLETVCPQWTWIRCGVSEPGRGQGAA